MSLRMDKNDCGSKIISFYPHRRIFLDCFDKIFLFCLYKSMLWWFLICQLLCKWWVTTADHSLLSVLYSYDSFFRRCVSPQTKNSSVMLLAGWFPQFFRIFRDCNSMYLPTWLIYQQVSNNHRRWSVAVTHHSQSDLQMSLIIHRVTVKQETAKACFSRIKHEPGIKRE